MTRDDIIRLACAAGKSQTWVNSSLLPFLEDFAALVAAAEREACAKVVESGVLGRGECAALIRARGETK